MKFYIESRNLFLTHKSKAMYPFPTHSVMFQSEKKKIVKPDTEKKEADAKAKKPLPNENKKEKKKDGYDPNIFRDHRGMWF
jgi:hypothetical protein